MAACTDRTMPALVYRNRGREMPVHEQLLGSTQPVLSISLEPGERIIAETGEFAWMTDSIQMTAGLAGLSDYIATGQAGTIAFASRLPGSILQIEVTPEREYLVHCNGFLAGTPGIEVTTGFQQTLASAEVPAQDFILRRIGGHGRAWIELSGDVVRRDLAAGTSLRTHPWHVGMADASVAVQMAELAAPFSRHLSAERSAFRRPVRPRSGVAAVDAAARRPAPPVSFRPDARALRTGCGGDSRYGGRVRSRPRIHSA